MSNMTGKRAVSVNATGTSVDVSGAKRVYVYNSGSTHPLYVELDDTLAVLVAAITAGTAFPIAPGASHTFGTGDYPTFTTLRLACATGGTTTADVGAEV